MTLPEGRSIDRNEMLIKGLIEMITSVLGSEIGDSAVHNIVEALLPHAPILQVQHFGQCPASAVMILFLVFFRIGL